MSPNSSMNTLSIVATVVAHPWLTFLFTFTTICIFTRLRTGWKLNTKQTDEESSVRRIPMEPYWIPWVGHTFTYMYESQEYLKRVSEKLNSGVFALRIGGGTHNFVVAPSLTNQIFNKANLPLDNKDFIYYVMEKVFGDHGTIKEMSSTPDGYDAIWQGAAKCLFSMMREPFLSQTTANLIRAVSDQAWNLVSGNTSWVDHSTWERSAKVEVKSVSRDGDFVAEADLHTLIRDYVSYIATNLLFGHAFMEHNPNAVSDLWLMDGSFLSFLTGLPHWLVPGLSPAYAARERLIEGIREHHEAMIKVMDGEDPGTRYDDLSDVPQFIWDRVECLKKGNASPRCYASSDFTLLWAMNINANHVIFWTVFHLFSRPGTLNAIRDEISPFVKIKKQEATGLPIAETPKLDIDVQGLLHKSPLLKGAMLEAMRLEVGGTPYKSVLQDFSITESEEDAKMAGKQYPETYLFKKGDMICIPGKVHQDSPTYFPDPEKFDVKRFWASSKEGEEEEKEKEEVTLDYQRMRIWGGGSTMCKGRKFAEREVLIFVASIIMCWDIEPVDKSNVLSDGRWKHPGRKLVSGAGVPVKNIRVKMSRRKP